MALLKKGWWKIKPKGIGNASGAFGVFDEIFHPQAHEATQIKEEQKRAVFQTGNEGDPLKIVINLSNKANLDDGKV
jgi:hypothetical protein